MEDKGIKTEMLAWIEVLRSLKKKMRLQLESAPYRESVKVLLNQATSTLVKASDFLDQNQTLGEFTSNAGKLVVVCDEIMDLLVEADPNHILSFLNIYCTVLSK